MTKIRISREPGWIGDFTRDQADGAIPNGARIMKTASEPGDGHEIGTLGTVLGSVNARQIVPDMAEKFHTDFCYFVEWDASPKHAIFVIGNKVARAS